MTDATEALRAARESLQETLGHLEIASVMPEATGKCYAPSLDSDFMVRAREALALIDAAMQAGAQAEQPRTLREVLAAGHRRFWVWAYLDNKEIWVLGERLPLDIERAENAFITDNHIGYWDLDFYEDKPAVPIIPPSFTPEPTGDA